MTKALLVTARHQSSSCRAAIRSANVAAREAHAVIRDRINIWCRYLLCKPLATQFTPAKVVGEDHKNIRFTLRTEGFVVEGKEKDDTSQHASHHGDSPQENGIERNGCQDSIIEKRPVLSLVPQPTGLLPNFRWKCCQSHVEHLAE